MWKSLGNIAKKVSTKSSKKIFEGHLTLLWDYILSGLIFSTMLPILNVLWHATRKGWNSLSFRSNNKCNGCGICMKICPVNNIEMVDNKPKWFEHCVLCFACLQWCPKEAINAGSVTEGMPRYHHPDVNISDIIKQKEIVKN